MALNDAIPSSATDVFKRNAEDADRLLNASGSVTNRLGNQLLTWEQISQSHTAWNNRGAWATATAYAINDIWEDGANWYVVLSAYTSGATAAADIAGPNVVVLSGNFVQGVEGLGFDEFAPNKNLVYPVESVEELAGLVGVLDDQQISLKGWHPDSGVGGGTLYWDAAKPKSEHNGGTVFSPTVPFSATTGDYLDGVGETDAAGSGCWVRRVNGEFCINDFGVLGDGTDEYVLISKVRDYMLETGFDCRFKKGVYDCGVNNWPFRNPTITNPALLDFKGATLVCESGVVFSTTSIEGADVLQLNAIKNFSVTGFPTITGTVSGSSAGTNGVSITNGGHNIYIEANPMSLGYVDHGSYLDGSKGFTLQNGATALNDYTNITIVGTVSDCGYGLEVSMPYDEFDISTSPLYAGINIDIVARDCWRGLALGASAATAGISDTNRDSNINIKASAINCAQPLGMIRWVRGSVDLHIENTKSKAELFKPFAADQAVTGVDIRGDYYSKVNVKGTMRECDYKIRFGGISQGGGIVGGSIGTNLEVDLDAETTNISEFSVEEFGGNNALDCNISLCNTVTSNSSLLIPLLIESLNNSITIGGKLSGSFSITMTGSITSPTGVVKWDLIDDVVTMYIPEIISTSNSAFTTFAGWPLELRPAQQQRLVVLAQDNGTPILGTLVIEIDGTATLYNGATLIAGAWTSSGEKGVHFGTYSYRLKN